jgi:lipopolysaccharide transport system ATP-binding protein
VSDSIIVEGLSKRFRRYSADRPWTLQEAVLRGFRGLKAAEYFWALKDVSFRVPAGKMTGLVGRNGAGKSTLLRLVGGVGRPTQGRILTQGRISSLIDLGVGFHPDLTGRENIFITGVISGLTRQEVARRFDLIVGFSELEDFIDSPFRTYSTGMRMRLAFSVAIHTDPDILLIDEVLAVGDMAFQQKCLDRIEVFKNNGCAILLVSHDSSLVERLCDEALWLNAPEIKAQGPAKLVVQQFVKEMQTETQRRTPSSWHPLQLREGEELRVNENRFGSLEMEITEVRLLNAAGFPATTFESGEAMQVEIYYSAPQEVPEPIFGVTISKEDGFVCYDASTEADGKLLSKVQGRGKISLYFERLDLIGGSYYIDVGAYCRDWAYAYDYHWHAYPLEVRPTHGEKGILRPPHRWEV